MPGEHDGLAVCRAIRDGAAAGPMPRVLMLTARDTVDDRVIGLDDGADDYLVKPFAFPELQRPGAHAAAAGRRAHAAPSSRWATSGSTPPARRRPGTGWRLDLTAKEFALLRYFLTRPGEVLSQEELLDHVWDENADPFTNTVRVTVGTLRRKLEAAGPRPRSRSRRSSARATACGMPA